MKKYLTPVNIIGGLLVIFLVSRYIQSTRKRSIGRPVSQSPSVWDKLFRNDSGRCGPWKQYRKFISKAVSTKDTILYQRYIFKRETLPSGFIEITHKLERTDNVLPAKKEIKVSTVNWPFAKGFYHTRDIDGETEYFIKKGDMKVTEYDEFCESLIQT